MRWNPYCTNYFHLRRIFQIAWIVIILLANLQLAIGQLLPTIVINEINYRSEFVDKDIEFIELYNRSGQTIELSNWQINGGIEYNIPSGTFLTAGAYLLIAQNPIDAQSKFGIPNALGPWIGKLKNKGEDVRLFDNNYTLIDKVDYKGWQEWPSTDYHEAIANDTEYCSFPYGGGSGNYLFTESYKVVKSIQKIHPDLPGRHAGSWIADSPTPKSSNVGLISQANIPVMNRVSKKPDKPTSGQPVTVEAEIENIANVNGTVSVNLEYQIVNPGDYINKDDPRYTTQWSVLSMSDNGVSPDSNAMNGVYTVNIPGNINQHRKLIRYRINVSSSLGYNKYFPDQNHKESNYAYYVYDAFPAVGGINLSTLDTIPDIQLITTSLDVAFYVLSNDGYPSSSDNDAYLGQGALVYNGKVYDHIGFRARGKDSRHIRLKRNLKFDMNSSRPFAPVNDCDKKYDEDRGKFALSGGWVNDANGHGLSESLVYKIAELSGAFNKYADYHHLRIVQNPDQNHASLGDFWGIYLALEDWGGDMLSEHDLPDGNIYSYKPPTNNTQAPNISHRGDLGPYDACSVEYENWNAIIGDSRDGSSIEQLPSISLSNILNNLDLDHYYADWAMNEICGNGETNYPGQHSYREYYNPISQKWTIQCGDYDEMFGMVHGTNAVNPKTLSSPTVVVDHPLKNQVSSHATLLIQAANKNRHVLDLLFGANDASDTGNNYPNKAEDVEQRNHLLASETKHIYNPSGNSWVNADYARWNGIAVGGDMMNYTNYNNEVINWYKNWFSDRAAYLLNNVDSPFSSEEDNIPNRPFISYIGPSGYPIDNLTFSNSSFSDPNGNNTFAAFEWRVGEYSDPNNPVYDTKCRPRYEIEDIWVSGEINNQLNSFTIDGRDLKPGRTYKVRMRYKDYTGRWGHWSDPVSFVAGDPINPQNYDIVINEIHYNGINPCVEFLEIYNNGSGTFLDDLQFDNGISYQFPPGTFLSANDYYVLAEDSLCFINEYGFPPNGQYSGNLNDGGEVIELTSFNNIIDSVKYNDKLPWDTIPDDGAFSLALIDPNLDNSTPVNWSIQKVGNNFTPSAQNVFGVDIYPDYTGIVINEIHYSPNNGSNYEFIEIKNTSNVGIYLAGAYFSNGVTFTFSTNDFIGPNQFLVIANDSTSFRLHYNVVADGEYSGFLNDSGETIRLKGFFGSLIDEVTYDNVAPWDIVPASGVKSLALKIGANNDFATNWSAQNVNYTVKAENSFTISCPGIVVENSNLAISSGLTQAQNYIQTNHILYTGNNATYRAGNYIELKSSFEVKPGSIFEAVIGNCQ